MTYPNAAIRTCTYLCTDELELVHLPWGYWRRAQTGGTDERARYARRLRRRNA
ncbi:MAG: hypothetical protein ABGY29_16130 [bacterium]